jgi:hypothetical protein
MSIKYTQLETNKIQGKHSLSERVVCETNLANNKNGDLLYHKPIDTEGSNFMTRLRIVCNPINNEICTSLFIGLALRESSNLVLPYICNMQNVYNPKPIHDH